MSSQSVSRSASAPDLTESDLLGMAERLAHEVRNPLATIKSCVQIVQRRGDPSVEVGEYLGSLLTAVARIDATLAAVGTSFPAGAGHLPERGEEEVPCAGPVPHLDLQEMIRHLAHQIRNPLAIIKSGVRLLQHVSHPPREVMTYYSSILEQVGRINATVSDLERFASVSAGHPDAVAVADAVHRAVALRRADGERAGVTLRVQGDGAPRVRIDQRNLDLALAELLANALRFSPPHTAVTVSWSVDADHVTRIDIDDQGPGIAAKHADSILRPFYSTSTQGTGLGLSIVDRVCRLAGGCLQWSNLPEVGCRFTVALPAL